MTKRFFIFGIISLLVSLVVDLPHDYSAYCRQWDWIMKGNDPWIGTYNAYGITYNFFAIFYYLNSKLPKVLFIITYLFSIRLILAYSKRKAFKHSNFVLNILLFNPIFWIFIVAYGNNDAFLAGITVIAIIANIYLKQRCSGALLAVVSNFKFTPIFLIPFLIFEKGKKNPKLVYSFIAVSVIIILMGYLIWGNTIIQPFFMGYERESKMFSIFRFIRGDYQPLQILGITNLDSYSFFVMLLVWLLSVYLFFRYSLDKYLMMVFAYSNIILFYKVNHHQFYVLLLFLSVIALINNYESIRKDKWLKISTYIFWVWIFLFTILYIATKGYFADIAIIREFLGAPTFVIHLIMNLYIIRHAFKHSGLSGFRLGY